MSCVESKNGTWELYFEDDADLEDEDGVLMFKKEMGLLSPENWGWKKYEGGYTPVFSNNQLTEHFAGILQMSGYLQATVQVLCH